MATILQSSDDVRAWIAQHVYNPDPGDSATGAVGLEIELFPFWVSRDGRPAARLALVEMMAIIDQVADRDAASKDGRPSWHHDEILVTEEPGAQLELAGPPDEDAPRALERIDGLLEKVTAAFADAGATLVSAGLDVWSEPDEVPVQLEIPRYEAMTDYFEARGGRQGHLLMCASCSIQVNVDLGPPAVARRRWELANLVAPVFTAAFAASPTADAVNGRAVGWRQLDPSRTGIAPPLIAGHPDPVEHVLADALRADVMMVARNDGWHAGAPGWSFGDWVADGHEEFGPPTVDDLKTHLTTLFPEARLRGFLEIRTIDALPPPWRSAAVALTTALFYDADALEEAAGLLEPFRGEMPELLQRAAGVGLGDDQLASLSQRVLGTAADAVERLGYPQRDLVHEYLERFTRRARSPSDELREALRRGEGFQWADELRPAA